MTFVDVFKSNFRLARKVCIVAPGPNGRDHYGRIPADFQIVAVSKAVTIPLIRADVWVMNHGDQPWFNEANARFEGIRVFSRDAVVNVESSLQDTAECYYFTPPEEQFLEADYCRPVDGVIYYGATVSACALQLAYNFGATEILLCGVDMSGDDYFDGTQNKHINHGAIWPAVRRMQPLVEHLTREKHVTILTLSPTKLEVPAYRD